MNDKHLHKLKNLVMITTGTVISLAGIAYIAVQYSKLLTAIFMKEDEDDAPRYDERLKSRFRQVQRDEGTSPDTLDDDDLSIEIEEAE